MMKELVMQDSDNNSLEVAIEALGKSIARLTEKGELHTTAVPGLSLFRREEPTEPITGMYERAFAWSHRLPSGCVSGMTPLCMTRTIF